MSRAATAMRPAARASARRPSVRPTAIDPATGSDQDTYWFRSEAPLTNLAFLCPLLALYEWGTRYYGQGTIIAFSLLQRFCALLNVRDSFFLPLAVVVTLLATHVVKKDRHRVLLADLLLMAIESVLLAVPLLVLWYAAGPYLARFTLFSNPQLVAAIPCIGAGIYEEFMFRLVLLNLLSFLLIDVLQLQKQLSLILMVVTSAILFSAYHYLGSEHFSTVTFIFRLVAGLYFSAIFMCRGYAVSCGAHASYDIIVVLLQFAR